MCMQNFLKLAEDRIRAELADFDLSVPVWLSSILYNDLYYVITLVTVCANSFCIGILLGWICTL